MAVITMSDYFIVNSLQEFYGGHLWRQLPNDDINCDYTKWYILYILSHECLPFPVNLYSNRHKKDRGIIK